MVLKFITYLLYKSQLHSEEHLLWMTTETFLFLKLFKAFFLIVTKDNSSDGTDTCPNVANYLFFLLKSWKSNR